MDIASQLPASLRSRLEELIPADLLEEVWQVLRDRRPTTLRVNTLKISPVALVDSFRELGVILEPVAWNPQAFVVINTGLLELTKMLLYKEGYCYVQSLSSMVPPLVLDPVGGEKILDLTAAPGSKTTQMAAMMKNTGEIVANDISHVRLMKLKANLKMQNATNVTVVKSPGQLIWQKYPEFFDKVLVDVPCSMEGRISLTDPKTYFEWSEKRIKQLSVRQKYLLRSGISSAKVGGSIVYSTCTLSPEENEGVIDWILKKEKGVVVLETIEVPGINFSPGLTSWRNNQYESSLSLTRRIMPSRKMEGFFVAKLKKIKSNVYLS
ncbi:MAG: RsmB/NOP family class I SAM-dependent RNA methyltransferase [Patescibacteria group bacterium]